MIHTARETDHLRLRRGAHSLSPILHSSHGERNHTGAVTLGQCRAWSSRHRIGTAGAPSGITSASALGFEPGDDVWPNLCAGFPPDQDTEMLQTYSDFAAVFNDAHVFFWHCVDERLDGA
jgi:hypothetical protein